MIGKIKLSELLAWLIKDFLLSLKSLDINAWIGLILMLIAMSSPLIVVLIGGAR